MIFLKKIVAVIVFWCASAQFCYPQSESECRIYLNFPYYSFEISGGFPQLYKISQRYHLLSGECSSFLNFVFTNPMLNKMLFPKEETPCKVYYEKFFNRCRCDTTAFLYIYEPPKTNGISKKEKIFDPVIFKASLLDIRDSALKALAKAYPAYQVEIKISADTRSIAEQESYLRKGSSTTIFSAHILGAAADFEIYFNKVLVNPKPKGVGIYKSFRPYRILGKYILDKGYFWGIPWDPGHMQLKRKFDEIITEYTGLQGNGNLIAAYCNVVKEDSIPEKYKPVIEIMDKKFGISETRKYDASVGWTEDTLLMPVPADSLYVPLPGQ